MRIRPRRIPASPVLLLLLAGGVLAGCGPGAPAAGSGLPDASVASWEWPTYAHDAQRTGAGVTTLTSVTVKTLAPAWTFPTGDAVTATPTVVAGTVYAGSWDGWFYAVSLATGKLRWKFELQRQDAVTPNARRATRDISSDGGLVTSSAWYEPGSGSRPDLVIFGGGYTLYALDARTGRLDWKHDYTGTPGRPPDPAHDGTRIFSSPVVAEGKVVFGVDTDGGADTRGYVVAASLDNGNPVWTYQTDVNAQGQVANDGCGGVWSSGTVLPSAHLVVFNTADCKFSNPPPLAETVFALHLATGTLAWDFRPPRADDHCDQDFGATANAGIDPAGRAAFLGVGGKDGTYYSLDPATGRLRWSTNVVFGGFAGGFIASAAYDGHRVYGATALGDYGRFEGAGEVFCDPSNPRDTPTQEPSVHAFSAGSGAVAWEEKGAASFASTTVAGAMTFNCPAFGAVVQVRAASTGALLDQAALPATCWSGIATVGDALVLGTGSSAQGAPDGIVALTPGGKDPVTPTVP